jgi:hypothetical protein
LILEVKAYYWFLISSTNTLYLIARELDDGRMLGKALDDISSDDARSQVVVAATSSTTYTTPL